MHGTKQDDGNPKLSFQDSSSKFPPATEQLVDLPVSALLLLKEAWNDNKPTSIFKSPTEAAWAPIRTSPYKTRFKHLSVENRIVTSVVRACRERATTITALLHGLALISLSSHLEAKKALALSGGTAIDQRRFLPAHHPDYPWFQPKRTIANYVTMMSHEFDSPLVAKIRLKLVANTDPDRLSDDLLAILWSAVIAVRGEIERRLNMGLKDDQTGLMKFIPDWRVQFKRDAKKPRKLSWFVTNLGVIDGMPVEHATSGGTPVPIWSIRRAQFTISTETPGAAIWIAAITTRNEGLVLTCTWQECIVQESLVESLMADLERWLAQIGESE